MQEECGPELEERLSVSAALTFVAASVGTFYSGGV